MTSPRKNRGASTVAVIVLGAALWSGCANPESTSLTEPSLSLQSGGASRQDVEAAIVAQQRHSAGLRRIPGVVGTAVGLLPNGKAAVQVFLIHADVAGLPAAVDGVPLERKVTGMIVARSNPTLRARPAPLGYSVGHPDITAGTIGARVVNSAGAFFALSNNHVLAASNGAALGDPILQPGSFDGGRLPNDQIGSLFAFNPIDFSMSGHNVMDAALASVTADMVGNSTPLDDGYGAPSPTIFGDADGNGRFDNLASLLNLQVMKYGRTTKLTRGRISGINGEIEVCYEVWIFFCVQSAYFFDQLIITPGSFSDGGDSGSLIVTDDAGKHPVALLYAGSDTETIANRIDLVLSYFGVAIDGGTPPEPPPPPSPLTDLAVTAVSAPGAAIQGTTVSVLVTVRNAGNQDITMPFNVALSDATDGVTIGTQSVSGLAPGATTTRTFSWNTAGASLGNHTLAATHDFADENSANDQASAVVAVSGANGSGNIHIGDLDGIVSDGGTTWSAIVEVTVHDANHQPLNGATIVGSWNRNGLNSNTCTSGDLGGNGTCIMLFPGLSKKSIKFVTFTVGSVTMAGRTYASGSNHDPENDSNGTSIKVNRP